MPDDTIFLRQYSTSCYFGKMIEGYSSDWVFDVQNGNITRVGKGGTDTYNMAGISYWKRSDALIIKKAIEASYKKPGHEKLFWDEIVDQELKRLKVQVEEISPESVIEVDTLEELSQLDSRYKTCLLYTSPSPRDLSTSRMPSSA